MGDGFDVDEVPVGLVRLDSGDRVVEANAEFLRWAAVDAVVGRPISELLQPVEDFLHIEGAFARMSVNVADPTRAALVVRSKSRDGALLTLMDASDRYEAGHRLRASHTLADRTRARLELIIDSSIAFAAASSEQRLGEILADTAMRSYGAEEAAVYAVSGEQGFRRLAGTNPFDALVSETALATAAGSLRTVLTVSGHAEAAAVSSSAPDLMREAGVHAVLAAPLRLDANILGFFACFFRHPREFDQEAAPLAEALAGQAAQTLVSIRLQGRLEHAALHDETTGLPNRRFLEERPPAHEGSGVSVVFIDLDGFKAINDAFGHQLGDDVLRELGRRLQATVREGDVIARYGGDEFVAVCAADASAALDIAERIVAAIAQPVPFLPPDFVPSASVGVASSGVDDGPSRIDRLIRLADHAMYVAKASGGNRVVAAEAVTVPGPGV
jgi:diguanylate cyclase (GGDEF)-like protein